MVKNAEEEGGEIELLGGSETCQNGVVLACQNDVVLISEEIDSEEPERLVVWQLKRHVVCAFSERQVVRYMRTTRRSITCMNDRTRNARRHAVCSKTLNDRAFKPRTTRRLEQ